MIKLRKLVRSSLAVGPYTQTEGYYQYNPQRYLKDVVIYVGGEGDGERLDKNGSTKRNIAHKAPNVVKKSKQS